MKFLSALVGVLLSIGLNAQQLEITYLANEGVLIQKGENKVLIDALFDGYFEDYLHPDQALREQMLLGKGSFDNVDLVLVTHRHRDHFETQVTGNFLEAHIESRFLSNYQVVDSLKLDYDGYGSFSSRVIGHEKSLKTIKNTFGEIKVISFFIEHAGGRRDPPAENLCFIIEIDGTKVLHVGDADMDQERFDQLKLNSYDIDVALIPYWYLADSEGKSIIESIGAQQMIGIHYPKAPSPLALEAIKRNYPKATVFKEIGQSSKIKK